MNEQYSFDVRMDYLLRMMAAAARERHWYELEAELISAQNALERAVRKMKAKRRARRDQGKEGVK